MAKIYNIFKFKLEDEQKASSDLRCDVLKLQSELKTLDMNLSMKDDMIKRTKVEFENRL